jgi:pimeloyl-ACP methyl ester carboxylesterase
MKDGEQSKAWADAGTWVGEGLRREVFFFNSAGVDLYGSLYAAPSAEASLGVLLCNSWGFEGDQASRLLHPLAIEVARAGGAAAIFHYPGFGDSHGDLASVTLNDLVDAASNALRELARRQPCERWMLAGAMFGGAIACLTAARHTEVERLLLLQPALRPSSYFARLERASRRSLATRPNEQGFVFGYPLPRAILDSAAAADAGVAAAIAGFRGDGTIVRHESPATIEGAPARFEQIPVAGAWRFGFKNLTPLLGAASKWIGRLPAEVSR